MQTRNPLLNDFADLMTDAFGAAQAVGDEAQAVMRGQMDRMIADMDLVKREEFDVLKASLAEAREEIEALKAELTTLKTVPAKKPASRSRKAAPKKSTAKSTD